MLNNTNPDTDAQILASIYARNLRGDYLWPDAGVEVILHRVTTPDGQTDNLLHWGNEVCLLSVAEANRLIEDLYACSVQDSAPRSHVPVTREYDQVQDGKTEPTKFWSFHLAPR